MTALKRVSVHCDHRQTLCSEVYRAPEHVQSKPSARRLAWSAGWHIRSYGDFCPKHRPTAKSPNKAYADGTA